jgi:hypothetical protein
MRKKKFRLKQSADLVMALEEYLSISLLQLRSEHEVAKELEILFGCLSLWTKDLGLKNTQASYFRYHLIDPLWFKEFGGSLGGERNVHHEDERHPDRDFSLKTNLVEIEGQWRNEYTLRHRLGWSCHVLGRSYLEPDDLCAGMLSASYPDDWAWTEPVSSYLEQASFNPVEVVHSVSQGAPSLNLANNPKNQE